MHPLLFLACLISSGLASATVSAMITSTSSFPPRSTQSHSTTAAVQLTQVVRWGQADACAQSCVNGAISSFSSYLSCQGDNPAACLCSSVDNIAASARSCGLVSCPLSTTTADKQPDYIEAKMIAYDYCSSNGQYRTGLAAVVLTTPMTVSSGQTSQSTLQATTSLLTSSNLTYTNPTSPNTTSAEPSHNSGTSGTTVSNWNKFGWQLTLAICVATIIVAISWWFCVWKRRKPPGDTEKGIPRSRSLIQRFKFNSWYCRGYDIWQDGQQPTHGFKILFDTGCHGSNWISPNIFEKLEAKAADHGQEYCFQDFNGNSFSAKRTTRLNFQRAGVPEAKVYSADFFIADRDTHFEIMLGADDLRNFNLLAQPVYPLIPAEPSKKLAPQNPKKAEKNKEAEKHERGRKKREEKQKRKRKQEQETKDKNDNGNQNGEPSTGR
ncbi:uncharacterized protein K444DRAFT_635254 [Hyaloscypha bicolor E]|uniref:CFEM domain-containing protein n=1 Tax=Hyaloscypha bicolor E TaxID=1095630 RepID=A0A2J6SRT4_9HELO|nr:uncharacterized protein K444DRAFT_635254 [Hyaloscypha bicolor E]PMD53449.1 hypothetical protein K444DRAFT_635254 [Hyaloscypha bicolor E]